MAGGHEQSTASETHHPQDGDLIVRRDSSRGASEASWHVSVLPGPPQVSCPTLEAALDHAQRYAALSNATVFFTLDGSRFEAWTPAGPAASPAPSPGPSAGGDARHADKQKSA